MRALIVLAVVVGLGAVAGCEKTIKDVRGDTEREIVAAR